MRQRSPRLARCFPAILASIALGAAAPAQTTDVGRGRIIDAPGNIRSFAPDGDAADVRLRTLFEDLGPDARLWYQHVMTLSNPFFEGRSGGTDGFERTIEYVQFYLEGYGLAPAFPEVEGGQWTSYVQPFSYRSSPRRTFTLEAHELAFARTSYEHGRDYAVLANSGGGFVEAPLAFVGYGIVSEANDYSSFDEDTDLSGRIAVMFRYEPIGDDGLSRWDDTRFSPAARLAQKFANVVDRGAAGILMVSPPGAVHARHDLETLDSSAGFGRSRDIPILQVSAEVADVLLRGADPNRRGVEDWRRLADEGAVGTVLLDDAAPVRVRGTVDVNMDAREAPSANIAGVLRGRGDLADEWIVIGGHCDHVGYGRGGGARPGSRGSLHPGADDNASGTAGMLVMAKWLTAYYAAADEMDLRSILFMAFGAEEVGLRGSAWYLDHPTIDPERITFMLNMDMIGRLRSNTLMIGGTGSAEEFDWILPPHVERSGLTCAFSPVGSGPSDHANFNGDGIPVLFMFTGIHDEYHQPGDEGYTVNPDGAIRIIEFSESIVREIVARPERLTYASTGRRARRDVARGDRDQDAGERGAPAGRGAERTTERSTPADEDPAPAGDSRTGARVQFGIVPNYTAELERGILVDDITPGTSADDAGLRGGDVLLAWDDQELGSLRQFMELLVRSSPGDTVQISVLRGDEEIVVPVTLKARQDG